METYKNYCSNCDRVYVDKYCPSCEKDVEGFTLKDRMRKRPTRECHYSNRVVYKNKNIKPSKSPFADVVVEGSLMIRTLE